MRTQDTICYKHDQISSLADQIKGLAEDMKSLASDIDSMASDAKDDGQRMENGLDTKRERIEYLELCLSEMEKDRDYWKDLAKEYGKDLDAMQSL